MRKATLLAGAVSLVVAGLGAVDHAQAQKMRGAQFITAMKSNTLTGKTNGGATFNVFFIPGGQVTYEDSAGVKDVGKWRLDKNDDVCVTWNKLDQGKEQCFVVSASGNQISWKGKTEAGRGTLRGNVSESRLAPR